MTNTTNTDPAVTFQAWDSDFRVSATILGPDNVRYSCTKDGEPRFTDLTLCEARRQVEGLVAAGADPQALLERDRELNAHGPHDAAPRTVQGRCGEAG